MTIPAASLSNAVAADDRLLVLEAMKMEHRLTARIVGTVGSVHAGESDQVGVD